MPPPLVRLKNTDPKSVQGGGREGLPLKERPAVGEPWRGYKGLYHHGGAFPIQGLWGQAAALVGSRVHETNNP